MAASNSQRDPKNFTKSPNVIECPETPLYQYNSKLLFEDDIMDRRSCQISPCLFPASNYQKIPDSATSLLKLHTNTLLSSTHKMPEGAIDDRPDSGIYVLASSYNPPFLQSSRKLFDESLVPVQPVPKVKEKQPEKNTRWELSPEHRKEIIAKYRAKRSRRVFLDQSMSSSEEDQSDIWSEETKRPKKKITEAPFAERIKNRVVKIKFSLKKKGRKVKNLALNNEGGPMDDLFTVVRKEPQVYY